MGTVIRRLLFFLPFFLAGKLSAMNPITPERVFTPEEIQTIIREKNFFLYHNLDDSTPVWRGTHRRYGSHYFADRTHYMDMDEVIHTVLTDGFPIKYRMEQLYRAKLGIHTAIGNALPGLNIKFGQNAVPLNPLDILPGLFNFLLPQNWLAVAAQRDIYEATKYLLLKDTFDQILSLRLLYLKQHQQIQDFETINYYLIHAQILARIYGEDNRIIRTFLGQFARYGTDMGVQRGIVKFSFDDLALQMPLEKIDGHYSVASLNIADIHDLPTRIGDLDELPEVYGVKEKFIEQVIRNSVELKAVREFYEAAKLGVGVSASGNLVNFYNNSGNNQLYFATLGYGTLPAILTVRSFARTARLDVLNGYINMLDQARRAFDTYTNAFGGYAEASRSLALNRKALKANLDYLMNTPGAEPDPALLLCLNNLIEAEFRMNSVLHVSLAGKAMMDRFLLADQEKYLHYLPSRGTVEEFFNKVKHDRTDEMKKEEVLNRAMTAVKKASILKQVLYDHISIPALKDYTQDDIVEAVKYNIGNLLFSKWSFYKHRKFFEVLALFLEEHEINLTETEKVLLQKKRTSWWARMRKLRHVYAKVYRKHFDFENFTVDSHNPSPQPPGRTQDPQPPAQSATGAQTPAEPQLPAGAQAPGADAHSEPSAS